MKFIVAHSLSPSSSFYVTVSSYAYIGNEGSKGPKNTNRSRHNQIYWATSSAWYAVGLGATSFVDGQLLARPRTLSDYKEWVNDLPTKMDEDSAIVDPAIIPRHSVVEDEDDRLTDIIMKRLRTADGLDLDWISKCYGDGVRGTILKGAELGLDLGMAEVSENQAHLRLTDPQGFLYSNYIISSIFSELGYE